LKRIKCRGRMNPRRPRISANHPRPDCARRALSNCVQQLCSTGHGRFVDGSGRGRRAAALGRARQWKGREGRDEGVKLADLIRSWWGGTERPLHLKRGALGEGAARKFLRQNGLKFLTANFRSRRGEIDLIFRDDDCLVFIEVKTRSSEDWVRPAAAVNARKRRLLSQTALDYLRLLSSPAVKIRFDIVEVLLADGAVREIRHLPNAFPMARPYRYG
jgi:putative endonuclease